ncbi:hypothetical protein CHS0354_026298 [Potamilus streckersoni]|uniref:Mitochondria-eating protein n=1 Tax=Potamilus streckersoni TaxID=2493646 RepID=A0AAE0TC12_9BIVA|nr:hypothetical protein CHS0354_026298 [Potamilus streckersoni]
MAAGGPWTFYAVFVQTYNKCRTNVLQKPNVITLQNNALQQLLKEKDEEIVRLTENCNQLRTRLSEIGAMQLTAGNPNITDLSDPNRPDKLAEQFSELYDNLWTDCFQNMVDYLEKTEEEAVQILLTIIKTAYDISLERSKNITKSAKEALETLVGKSDEEPEKVGDTLIQETLHKLKSYRTKNFRTAPKYIAMIIEETLLEKIGKQLITTCRIYIDECVRISWLMCIKDPPMYIFCEKEDVFDKNRFVEYTKKGTAVSYVVWPVLYLHYNGPLMRKGVAQGVEKRKPNKMFAVGTYVHFV